MQTWLFLSSGQQGGNPFSDAASDVEDFANSLDSHILCLSLLRLQHSRQSITLPCSSLKNRIACRFLPCTLPAHCVLDYVQPMQLSPRHFSLTIGGKKRLLNILRPQNEGSEPKVITAGILSDSPLHIDATKRDAQLQSSTSSTKFSWSKVSLCLPCCMRQLDLHVSSGRTHHPTAI